MILNAFIILLEDVSTYELEQTFNEDIKKINTSDNKSNIANQTKDTIPGIYMKFIYLCI